MAKYHNIKEGRFLDRPQRFIANVEIDGKVEICHVKNTGRSAEIFVPGAKAYVQESDGAHRKTKYDLVSVYKGNELINVDSQIPNKVFREWVEAGNLFSPDAVIKAEVTYGKSRFDFYIEDGERKIFVEVKGVTLESDGRAMFPDTPTERGVKHVKELCACLAEGYEAYVVFIVKMKGVHSLSPNEAKHPAFAQALREAVALGVKVLALDCVVTADGITVDQPVPFHL
ncbi:MAG: DNA/RNA nuclease SfsA [Defluviitaleaceae bacterium]|nr:DNA/RNA nuclease SfsA [Defluviitaleaceae bacterium]